MKKQYKNYNRILAGELYGFSTSYSIDATDFNEPLNEDGLTYAESEEIADDLRT